MPKQTLLKRVERIVSDSISDSDTDIRARWQKVVDDGIADGVIAALGPMPDATLDDIPLKKAIYYAGRDADGTLRINPILNAGIDEMGLRRSVEIDYAIIPMLVRMMQVGMLVDASHLQTLDGLFADALADIEYQAHQAAGERFLLASGDQVAKVLFGRNLGLSAGRMTKTRKRQSTDNKTLEALRRQHLIAGLILDHRELSKLRNTYTKVLPRYIRADGRLHPNLRLTRVPSGRLAADEPNILAIPVRTALGKEIRRAFVAPPGCQLGSVDLHLIELRALAVLSQDEVMLDACSRGTDLHAFTASEALFHVPVKSLTPEQRQWGKTANFAIANGVTALGLLDQFRRAGIRDADEVECQRVLDSWFGLYKRVLPWFEKVWEEGRRNGFIRCGLSGRIYYCPGLRSPIEKVRLEAERQSTNWMIQTWAETVVKLGMARLWEYIQDFWINEHLEPLLQIHDEVLLEVNDTALAGSPIGRDIVDIMCAAVKVSVPIVAHWSTGATWADLK